MVSGDCLGQRAAALAPACPKVLQTHKGFELYHYTGSRIPEVVTIGFRPALLHGASQAQHCPRMARLCACLPQVGCRISQGPRHQAGDHCVLCGASRQLPLCHRRPVYVSVFAAAVHDRRGRPHNLHRWSARASGPLPRPPGRRAPASCYCAITPCGRTPILPAQHILHPRPQLSHVPWLSSLLLILHVPSCFSVARRHESGQPLITRALSKPLLSRYVGGVLP
jgi:hypothetical protein